MDNQIYSNANQVESIMRATLENLNSFLDVNHVVGAPITVEDTIVVPFSKVTFGFVGGGTEFTSKKNSPSAVGGSGAGVSITPVGFLVCGEKNVLLKVDAVEDTKWTDLAKCALNLLKK
jgi:Uncharacterized conserved protein